MTDLDQTIAPAIESSRLHALRGRIGWLCQTLRFALIAYCFWMIATMAMFWTDEARIVANFAVLKIDVEGMADWQRLCGFGVSFVIWALLVLACYSGWRLFSTYLDGRIFTPDAAGWLRRLALMGLAAALLDIVTRPLMSTILTAHKATGHHIALLFFRPEDLSTVVLLATLLALAQIQKTAADIADENAQIV